MTSVTVAIYKDTVASGQMPVRGAYSNKYGFYSIPDVKPGVYYVTASYIGLEKYIKRIVLQPGRDIIVNIGMKEGKIKTQTVVVEGNKEIGKARTISKVNITSELISKMPSLGGEIDIFRVLQLLPGVQQASELSSGLYVRGGSPDQNLTLLDGVIVYNPTHLGGFLSAFNADAIRDINLMKGGFPAEYGGRISSVLDLTMKEGTKEKLSGSAGISLISSRLTLEGPLSENSTFMISGRRMYLDLLMMAMPGAEDAPQYYFYDLNAKVNLKIGENDRLFLSGFLGRDVLNSPEREFDNSSFNINWGNSTLNLRWMHIESPELFTNFSLIYTDYKFRTGFNNDGATNSFESQTGIEDIMLRAEAEYFPYKDHSIKSGLEFISHKFKIFSLESDMGVFDLDDFNKFRHLSSIDVGLYVSDDWKIDELMNANLGLRMNYYQLGGYLNIEPRMSFSYALAESSFLKAALTLAHQPVHLVTRNDINLPTDSWIPASDKIKPGRSWQGVLGFETTFLQQEYQFTAEMYYKDMTSLYEYRDDVSFISNIPIEDQLTEGRGEAYGLELFLNKRIGDFTGWVGYTLAWTIRYFDELNNGKPFFPRYDRRHDINIVVTYELGESWELGATWVYGTGQAYTVPTGTYSISEPTRNRNNYYGSGLNYDFSDRNAYRLPAYHKMDLNFMHKFEWFNLPFQFSINIYNAYNRLNPFAVYIGYDEEDYNKKVLKKITLFPIIPTFGLSFKF